MRGALAIFFVCGLLFPFATQALEPAEVAKFNCNGKTGAPNGEKFTINAFASAESIQTYLKQNVLCPNSCYDVTVNFDAGDWSVDITVSGQNKCKKSDNRPQDEKRGCAKDKTETNPSVTAIVLSKGTKSVIGPKNRCQGALLTEMADRFSKAKSKKEGNEAMDVFSKLSEPVKAPGVTTSIDEGTNEGLSKALQEQGKLSAEDADKVVKSGNAEAALQAIAKDNKEDFEKALKASGVTLTPEVRSNFASLSPEEREKAGAVAATPDPDPETPPGNTFDDPEKKDATPEGPTDMDRAKHAICRIESGCNYYRVGPIVTKGSYAGDRAYGKYQMMGKNITAWTCEMGQCMTPQQVLRDPDAQERLFEYKFGQLAARHGWEGAAGRWFGPGTDQLGTTNARYRAQFLAYFNGEVPSNYSTFRASPFGSISNLNREEFTSPFSLGAAPAGNPYGGYQQQQSTYAQPSYSQNVSPTPGGTSASGYTYSQPTNTLPQPTVSPIVLTPPSVTPTPQSKALEEALKGKGKTSSSTPASPLEPAAAIIVQPSSISRGQSLVVSWSSVGMSVSRPCNVYVSSGGTNVALARGNEGSRTIPTGATTTRGVWDFTLQCTSSAGNLFERKTSAEIR